MATGWSTYGHVVLPYTSVQEATSLSPVISFPNAKFGQFVIIFMSRKPRCCSFTQWGVLGAPASCSKGRCSAEGAGRAEIKPPLQGTKLWRFPCANSS